MLCYMLHKQYVVQHALPYALLYVLHVLHKIKQHNAMQQPAVGDAVHHLIKRCGGMQSKSFRCNMRYLLDAIGNAIQCTMGKLKN